MKPALRLGMSQHLSLTPQLKQAIRLLQLSAIELEIEVREALESNPLLEQESEAIPEADAPVPSANGEASSEPEAPPSERIEVSDSDTAPESGLPEIPEHAYEDFDSWSLGSSTGTGSGSGGNYDAEGESLEARTAAPETLQDHLRWQLNLTPLSPRDHAIATAIIESLEEDGYLREPVEAIQAALRPEFEANADEIEAVRHRVQRFDPVGVASRTLSECLDVQLSLLDEDTEGLAVARRLVVEHLESLAKLERDKLVLKLGATPEEVEAAVDLVKSCEPRPGNGYGDVNAEYIVPDAYATKQEGRWRVRLNPSCQPSLSINRQYERLAAESRGETGGFLKGRLQEARWLIKSLKARGETMMKVAGCIVRQQSAFLDYGAEAMRPLTLKQVADEIGVHESTVSRITTRKYLHTPRGTFEFKHFFSVGLATSEGGEASATAIRAMIKKLVEDEDPRKPMSDAAISGELGKRGIEVARRTVAKYREAMNIPASSDRCRLA
ncbi:MAG TPA: RNA polymerase factor sigma-54 [Candidatus Saccharimonadia bacterium]|nr:RNA polymerase factor sigma-54 [Candidatus Saccharimonadia bacterium]